MYSSLHLDLKPDYSLEACKMLHSHPKFIHLEHTDRKKPLLKKSKIL